MTFDQREQTVQGHQVNVGGDLHAGQIGDNIYNEIIVTLESFDDLPPAILQQLRAPSRRAEDLRQEIEIAPWEPETVLIPAGSFIMGSEAGADVPAASTPTFGLELPAYRIGRYPVTNGQYARFIQDSERLAPPELGWTDGNQPGQAQEQLPVAGVTWYDALAYCLWLARETGRPYTLPSEAQWEKAARGPDGRLFPWGDAWQDGSLCNEDSQRITAVDQYPGGQSPYGCFDMVGNVREWTTTLWGEKRRQPEGRSAYPWQPDDGRDNLKENSQIRRITRGGAALPAARGIVLRATRRGSELPLKRGLTYARLGFRIALNLEE